MAFQRLEPAGPRLLSAPANSLTARRFRLSQRLILISFGPLLSLRLLFRQHKLAGLLALLSIGIIPYEIKRSVAKHEWKPPSGFCFLDRPLPPFCTGGWFMFYYTHFASLCKTEIFRRLSQGEPPHISPLYKIYSLFKLCERSVVHFIDSPWWNSGSLCRFSLFWFGNPPANAVTFHKIYRTPLFPIKTGLSVLPGFVFDQRTAVPYQRNFL